MSEQDQNKLVGRITKKLLWAIVPFFIVLMSINGITNIRANNKKANESFVKAHYSELYLLIAELSTTQAMYIKSNDADKELLGKRIDYIIQRIDKLPNPNQGDVMRGPKSKPTSSTSNRKYGINFIDLI